MSRLPETLYPVTPGFMAHGPSEEAATAIASVAKTLRDLVLQVIAESPGLTADQIATKLNRSILSIRPRVSELRRLGQIRQTAARGRNQSGMSASTWIASPSTAPESGGAE